MELCPICGKPTNQLHRVVETYVISVIRKKNPDWVEADGSCRACIELYKDLNDAVEGIPTTPSRN